MYTYLIILSMGNEATVSNEALTEGVTEQSTIRDHWDLKILYRIVAEESNCKENVS